MFAEKLVEARKNAGLSQEELAEKLYVTRQAISRWETGKTEPDLQTVTRLCGILQVKADYFIASDAGEDMLFKTLAFGERQLLQMDFIREHKGIVVYTLLYGFLFVLDCVSIGFSVAAIAAVNARNQAYFEHYGVYGTESAEANILLLAATIVLLVITLALAVAVSVYYSAVFNSWLRRRNIIRTNKFFISA